MRRTIEAVWFPGDGQYERMARVLAYSAATHCPEWDVFVRRIDTPTRTAARQSDAANWWKLGHWRDAICGAYDGQEVLLLDADTFVTGNLDGIWDGEYDVAYTVRDDARFPFNAGVIAVRVSDKSRAFMRAWAEVDSWLISDPAWHLEWRKRYGGMNQASLGCLLESPVTLATTRVAQLPCLEWNCEDTCWSRFDPERTKIVHVKSGLRATVFGDGYVASLHDLSQRWHQVEREIDLGYNRG